MINVLAARLNTEVQRLVRLLIMVMTAMVTHHSVELLGPCEMMMTIMSMTTVTAMSLMRMRTLGEMPMTNMLMKTGRENMPPMQLDNQLNGSQRF